MLAKLFLISWIFVLLQGALRKWFFPGITAIYLVQDVPLFLAYVYGIQKGIVSGGKLVIFFVLSSLALVIQALMQIMLEDYSLFEAAVGLHHYLYYLPILFLLPACMSFSNRQRFIQFNVWAGIPMGLLAIIQSALPGSAWINRTPAGDDTAFPIPGFDAIRATGTFSFTLLFAIWCGIALAFVIGEWLRPVRHRAVRSTAVLSLSTLSIIIATADSGSRTAIVGSSASLLGGVAVVVITRQYRHILRFALIIAAIPALVAVASITAPSAFQGVASRFSGDEARVDLVTRIHDMTLRFVESPGVDLLGQGIGSGLQAARIRMVASYSDELTEDDNMRIVQELGWITGDAIVFLRYIAGFLLVVAAVKATTLKSEYQMPHALPLAFTLLPTLTVGDLVRVAPMVATQTYFCLALILSSLVYSPDPLLAAETDSIQMRFA